MLFIVLRPNHLFQNRFAFLTKDPSFPIEAFGVVVTMVDFDSFRTTTVANVFSDQCETMRRTVIEVVLVFFPHRYDHRLLVSKSVGVGGETEGVDDPSSIAVREFVP